MSTLKEIIDRNNRQLEQEFDNQLYLDWINQCMDDLAEDLFMPTRTTLNAVNNVFTLPSNYKDELRVRVVGDQKFATQVDYDETLIPGFVFYNNEITIVNRTQPAQIEVLYNRRPSYIINDPTAVPDIPEAYHYVIDAFCKKQAMLFIEDIADDERFRFYSSEYENGKSNLINNFKKTKSQTNNSMAWTVVR